MRATARCAFLLTLLNNSGALWRRVRVTRCSRSCSMAGLELDFAVALERNPLATLAAAQFLAEEMGDELPLRTGPARTALFMASLLSPGSLPNAFATTRWQPSLYVARHCEVIVGVLQTALANVPAADGAEAAFVTVHFYQNVVVSERYRRKGVATALLRFAACTDVRFPSALAVEPQNDAAVQLYRRMGFEFAVAPERDGMRLMLRDVAATGMGNDNGSGTGVATASEG